MTEVVVKDATIKQLSAALNQSVKSNDDFEVPTVNSKKDK